MNMSDIANNAKITIIWRGVVGFCSIAVTAAVGAILSYASSSNVKQDALLEKLNSTSNDVAQIKWELPVIKETAKNDKADIQKQLDVINLRIETIRSSGEQRDKLIAHLQLEQALLKQKLQIP